MLKTIFVTMLMFCSVGLYAESPTEAEVPAVEQQQQSFQIPEEFFVRERWFSWSSSFDLETPTHKLGRVNRRIFSLLLQYDFYDAFDKLQANAKMRFLALRPVFDVTDADEKPLGTVYQYIFTFFPTFEIISPEEQTLAIAKLNFWGTKYTLRDPVTHEEFATLSRPFFGFRDHWTVRITNPRLFAQREIDPRLFVVVMTFQTDKDNWARQRQMKNLQMSLDVLSDEASSYDFNGLRNELESHRHVIAKIEPTEADIAFVENYVDEYLTAREGNQNAREDVAAEDMEEAIKELAEIENEQMYSGLEQLIPLVSTSELTDGQKSALFFMIDGQLKQMGY
jgi:uncharacterized protein YxjI